MPQIREFLQVSASFIVTIGPIGIVGKIISGILSDKRGSKKTLIGCTL
jgi:predicted MFS family arabinose efflux permease